MLKYVNKCVKIAHKYVSNFHKELQKSLFLSFKFKFSFGTAFYVVYGIMYVQQL